jgi:hypothetical protein
MGRLSDYLKPGKRTFTGTLLNPPTVNEIQRGKRAWANGSLLIGAVDTKPFSAAGGANRRLLLVQPPTGAASGSYNPATDARGLIINSERNLGLAGAAISLDANGYLYTSSSYQDFLSVVNPPRPPTNHFRKIEMWGKTKNAALSTDYGVRIAFNVQHWYNQFWFLELFWNGSAFALTLYEWNSPTGTSRATGTMSTAVDTPILWHLTLWYFDDTVWATAKVYQTNSIIDDEVISISYSIASRPYKINPGFFFGVRLTPGDQWLIRGFSVVDEP